MMVHRVDDMLSKLHDFVGEFGNRFLQKKRDKSGRYRLEHNEIFTTKFAPIMWKFINQYIAKNSKICQWLESCGIALVGKGDHKIMIVSQGVGLFPKQEELHSLWDTETGRKRKECSGSILTPSPMRGTEKRSRHGGGICSVKAFVEQHPESQNRFVRHLTGITHKGICAELADQSQKNVQAVALAVSINMSKVLSEHCVNEGILHITLDECCIESTVTQSLVMWTCICEGCREWKRELQNEEWLKAN
jgi:hypothetical protein